ncbi:DNA mismatch repair protein [Coemansia biformis]|uniref:DNA mismatch repair protein n=1 Tax=Coemansia biformis TaxID=1286918 RepID=A0A9W8CYP0_9FUNG|nr:DNA mismatch repair protein [Coemansia biformis]
MSADGPVQLAPIRRLDESVVNRIAAGEIIHRPSNALKELLENSLDAGATSIAVTVKDGGMKLLQIQDNGHGIRTEDLPIVCERFTTSKLTEYEDLSRIRTYGFRGEALASISHVAHLSITTKKADSDCAYRASYADGRLVPARPGGRSEPEPCAANNGTTIAAEDLFYNIRSRREALKNAREEYSRILEVASRYAIHNSSVAFTCRKAGGPKADLCTPQASTAIANIRQIFGSKIADSLVEIERADADLEAEFRGYVSSAVHEMHKTVFLLFINHRLVEHTPIRRAIESLYASILPKASRPFVYLDLHLSPANVDVNVHPTKREVRFLGEDGIVGLIVDSIHKAVLSANNSREFALRGMGSRQPSGSLSGSAPLLLSEASFSSPAAEATPSSTPVASRMMSTGPWSASAARAGSGIPASAPQKTPVNRTVRTNYKTLSLDSFSFGASPSLRRTRAQATIDPDFGVSPARTASAQLLQCTPPSPTSARAPLPNSSTERRRASSSCSGSLFAAGLPAATTRQSENVEPPPGQAPDHAGADAAAVTAAALGRRPSLEFPCLPGAPSEGPRHSGALPEASYAVPRAEPRVEVRLTSILNLRKELQRGAHVELTQILNEHTFVGFVDDRRALIQHQTRLYMVDFCKLSDHLFYHRCLFDFMNYGRLVLQPAPSIHELALIAASELGHDDPERAAGEVLRQLSDNREMLEEYYHITISDTGTIESLPMVIRDYSPDYDKLPLFLYNAARSVNWDDEQQFFKTFGRALASFYALEPPLDDDPPSAKDSYRLMVEHRIMSSFKGSAFWAPASILMENALVQLADLPDLYRIFERC